MIDFFGRGELRKLELMQLSSKPVKKRHQLCQLSDRLNIQRQFWNFQHFTILLEKGCHTECRSSWWAAVRLKSYLLFFRHQFSHINGDIAGAGIFVVDQRKSDLQNSLFMILNHGQGSNIDFGKYFKMCHIAHIEIIKVQVLWILTDKEYQNYANRKFQIAKYIYSDFELVRI